MRESQSSPNLPHISRTTSDKMRHGRSEMKYQFLENRISDDHQYGDANEDGNTCEGLNDKKDDTLDPVAAASNLQHSLRSLLRQKYRGGDNGKGRLRRIGSSDGMKITNFGLIDQPSLDTFLTDQR